MRYHSLSGCIVALGATMSAGAFEYRARWVERIGNTDFVIPGNQMDAFEGPPRRLRLQFGVFDSASGDAPAGGFVGWNVGTIRISGDNLNSIDRRTPGRLAPFNFAAGPSSNGSPPVPAGGDVDFQVLTDIDATLGTQAPFWGCTPAPGETPLPQPLPTIRGRNEYVSVFEMTTDPSYPSPGSDHYTITASGNLIAAAEWRPVGNPLPPDCGDPDDPNDNTPGQVVYAPLPTAPIAFTAQLQVIIPAPGVLPLLGIGSLFMIRRRR